jgi:hypothetical protein
MVCMDVAFVLIQLGWNYYRDSQVCLRRSNEYSESSDWTIFAMYRGSGNK